VETHVFFLPPFFPLEILLFLPTAIVAAAGAPRRGLGLGGGGGAVSGGIAAGRSSSFISRGSRVSIWAFGGPIPISSIGLRPEAAEPHGLHITKLGATGKQPI
jgi:hypothetical protein